MNKSQSVFEQTDRLVREGWKKKLLHTTINEEEETFLSEKRNTIY